MEKMTVRVSRDDEFGELHGSPEPTYRCVLLDVDGSELEADYATAGSLAETVADLLDQGEAAVADPEPDGGASGEAAMYSGSGNVSPSTEDALFRQTFGDEAEDRRQEDAELERLARAKVEWVGYRDGRQVATFASEIEANRALYETPQGLANVPVDAVAPREQPGAASVSLSAKEVRARGERAAADADHQARPDPTKVIRDANGDISVRACPGSYPLSAYCVGLAPAGGPRRYCGLPIVCMDGTADWSHRTVGELTVLGRPLSASQEEAPETFPSAGAEHLARTGKTVSTTVLDEAGVPPEHRAAVGLCANMIMNTTPGLRPSDAMRSAVRRYQRGGIGAVTYDRRPGR